jgi:peptide deformylase
MAVRELLEIGDPQLAEVAPAVDVRDIRGALVQAAIVDVIDSMRAANGSGLAANQIGIPMRIFAVEVDNNPRYPYKPPIPLDVIINPELKVLTERTFQNYEGCLSVPGIRGVVTRHLEIEVTGFDGEGSPMSRVVRGYSAGTYQHEYDHLDGLLFPHKVTDPKTFCSWSAFKTFYEADFRAQVETLVREFGA